MTERVSPAAEGPPACPFLALADDRDARFDHPDRSHRCYAESPPAPRATAHQITFCLGAAFASCPTFVDWARREVARVKSPEAWRAGGDEARVAPPPAGAASFPASRSAGSPKDAPAGGASTTGAPAGGASTTPGRPPGHRRDWASPPPWTAESAAAAASAASAAEAPGRGAGADVDADGHVAPPSESSLVPGTPAFLAGRGRAPLPPTGTDERPPETPPSTSRGTARYGTTPSGGRPTSGPARPPAGSGAAGLAPARPRPSSRQRTVDRGAPAWEEPRRYEAYPTIRTRVGMPRLSPLLLGIAAVAVAAAALFFLPPMFLGLGGSASPTPTAAPSAEPTVAASPTPTPAPTPTVYIVKSGDTLSKIASSFGLTTEDLLAVNPQITDPDEIDPGDQIVIPQPEPSEIVDTSGEGSTPAP